VDDLIHFALAALALLLMPGPTNALLAACGATAGFPRSLRLLLSTVGGYATGIALVRVVLLAVGGGCLDADCPARRIGGLPGGTRIQAVA
jgi:threonine/homoserine/homoserine lactone efflux protein